MSEKDGANEPIVIKKYANRRLYNTATSTYVTLEHLAQLVRDGEDFVVRDAKSGEDITRSVLTQIIFEAENSGQSLLPISFLRRLIGYYGHGLEALVPRYLDASIDSFQRQQDEMQRKFANDIKQFEEVGRQNLAIFERAMSMFNPFAATEGAKAEETAPPAPAPAPAAESKNEIDALKQELHDMRRRLDEMLKKG